MKNISLVKMVHTRYKTIAFPSHQGPFRVIEVPGENILRLGREVQDHTFSPVDGKGHVIFPQLIFFIPVMGVLSKFPPNSRPELNQFISDIFRHSHTLSVLNVHDLSIHF